MINASKYDMGFTFNKIQMSKNNVKWMNGEWDRECIKEQMDRQVNSFTNVFHNHKP